MFQKNHVRKQGLEHVHVPVLFLFPVNPEHGQHWETNTRRNRYEPYNSYGGQNYVTSGPTYQADIDRRSEPTRNDYKKEKEEKKKSDNDDCCDDCCDCDFDCSCCDCLESCCDIFD